MSKAECIACARREPTDVLAAALVIATGTAAYAVPLTFHNPNGPDHYDWRGGYDYTPFDYLDIRVSAKAQTNTFIAGVSLSTSYYYGYASYAIGDYIFGWSRINSGGSGAGILTYVPAFAPPWDGLRFPMILGKDALVGPGLFADSTYLCYRYPTTYSPDPYVYDLYPGIGHWLDNGVATFGLKIFNSDTAAFHYGWIKVELDKNLVLLGSGSFTFEEVADVKAWGWETEPNTPIRIPAPATIAALALGAGVVAPMKKRRSR